MTFLRVLQIFLIMVATTNHFTVAMICKKLIPIDLGNIVAPAKISMERARYEVETYARVNSTKVENLIAGLDGANDTQYNVTTFTAVLQPKDLKKVANSYVYTHYCVFN